MISVRNYKPEDYPTIVTLYKDSTTYGGQFDEARDSTEQLLKLSNKKQGSILVAETEGRIVGTVTLFEDGRSAWLYRFAINNNESSTEITDALFSRASDILKSWGHSQVLVYAPTDNKDFENRYTNLGFTKGNDFTAYWKDL